MPIEVYSEEYSEGSTVRSTENSDENSDEHSDDNSDENSDESNTLSEAKRSGTAFVPAERISCVLEQRMFRTHKRPLGRQIHKRLTRDPTTEKKT
jgi:hypothetical protein